MSPATLYKLKAKYGGLEVSDARRLRQREDENGKLKRLLAESVLDNAILKFAAAERPLVDGLRCRHVRRFPPTAHPGDQ